MPSWLQETDMVANPDDDQDAQARIAEAAAITRRRMAAGVEQNADEWGLAFSGGGIRSATFCLGLARALAKNQALRGFDYLSTVSGGGYIGSAIGRLYSSNSKAPAVDAGIADDRSLFLWWMRRNGRFLLPQGALDVLRALANHFRGFLATQFEVAVLLLFVSTLVLLPHLLLLSFASSPHIGTLQNFVSPLWAMLLPVAGLMLSSILAYWFTRDGGEWPARLLDAAICAAALVGFLLIDSMLRSQSWAGNETLHRQWLTLQWLLACFPVGWLMHLLRLGLPARDARVRFTNWLAWLIAGAAALSVAGLLDLLTWMVASQLSRFQWSSSLAGLSGTGLLLALGRAASKRLAQASQPAEGGLPALKIAHYIGLLLSLMLLGLWLIVAQWFVFFFDGAEISVCALSIEHCQALASRFDLASHFSTAMGHALILVFALTLYIAASLRNVEQLNRSSLHSFYRSRLSRAYVSCGNSPDHDIGTSGRRFPISPLLPSTTPAVVIDTVSLGDFAKRPLESSRRLFRRWRTPANQAAEKSTNLLGKITSYLEYDDVKLGDYHPHEFGGPIHLVNVCVNQSVDDRTDSYNADRKGVALAVSSFGCEFGTSMPRPSSVLKESGLAQWIAISGAAAGSGMGSMTSAGLAALCFLSGVRLGYWWKPKSDKSGAGRPRAFSKYHAVIDEWFGRFPGLRNPVFYLSDGGHFDNTGVYALLKREPALIVAADCGADPGYLFADIESLVRKARIDYDAEIQFIDPASLSDTALGGRLRHFGTPDVIGADPGPEFLLLARVQYRHSGRIGALLVVKPRRVSELPIDIAGYSDRDPMFPQQTTADQFFDEAQWESYCELGRQLGELLTVPMLQQLPDIVRRGSVAAPATLQGEAKADRTPAAPLPVTPIKTRRERIGATVGKTLSAGAAISVLVAGWQIWQDARDSMNAAQKEEVETLATLLRPGGDKPSPVADILLQQADAPRSPVLPALNETALEKVIQTLEQLGALHGNDIQESARMRVVEAIESQCILKRRSGEQAGLSTGDDELGEACAAVFAVLKSTPRSSWSSAVDNYWNQALVNPNRAAGKGCATTDGSRRTLMIHLDGPVSDELLGRAEAAASSNNLRVRLDRSGTDAGDSFIASAFKSTTLVASAHDMGCGEAFLSAFREAYLDDSGGDIEAALAGPSPIQLLTLPAFSTATGTLQQWLRASPDAPSTVAGTAGARKEDYVAPQTVYVQFRGAVTRELINRYRQALTIIRADGKPWIVPNATRIGGDYTNQVKYFSPEDSQAASRLASMTNDFFHGSTCRLNSPIGITESTPTGNDTTQRFEIWVAPDCSTRPAKQ
jgi:hypothetical protein